MEKFTSTAAVVTTVADSAVDVQLLAANDFRRGASIANDSSAALFIRVGGLAATVTAYTVKVIQDCYWEVPFGFTGAIRGIWASDPGDGAARITEYT